MAKEFSLQIFPINLFVKEAYRKKYNGLRRNNSLLICNNFDHIS